MAVSGSIDYTQNRDQVILSAYQLLNVYGTGKTISGEDMAFAVTALNNMLKAWNGKGIHLWAMDEGILFLSKNVGSYNLGASGVRASTTDDAVISTLSGAYVATNTALTVGTTTGMAAADNIGIVLVDETIHWDTIASVDTATTLTLTTGLASAAADAANVYTYTTALSRPLKIHNCRRVTGVDSATTNSAASEVPMDELSQSEYDYLPTKGSNGAPSNFYYSPKLAHTSLSMWPRPDAPSYYLKFRYSRIINDMDNPTDNFDLPQEWLEVISWQLAIRLAPAFGKSELVQSLLLPMASAMLEDMLNYDNEVASISFAPEVY